jgi:hypothetical protein
MADGLQLSRDRWLILYSTRGFLGVDQGFRGSDNDRSILYQLRRDGPLGPVLKEGLFARYREDWDALSDGGRHLRQHCHTGGFGVPLGALVRGRRVPHENLFVATWYRSPRAKGRGPDDLPSTDLEDALFECAFGVEWVQFRLNETGSDIEVVQPPRPLRQKGYEDGPAFCGLTPCRPMNKWYVKPAPCADDLSEWAQAPHFANGIAVIRFRFSAISGLYEWVQTGPLLATDEQSGLRDDPSATCRLTETSLARLKDGWALAARTAERLSRRVRGMAWMRAGDLFGRLPEPVFPGAPLSKSPCAAFVCPDGALRLFTNDETLSPYRNDRDPLYCWDVDPDAGFRATNPRVVFDAVQAGLPAREESWPRVDMPNLMPHPGGREQVVTCRVRLRQRRPPHTRLSEEERRRTGLYHARIIYDRDQPPAWRFA